MMAIWINEVGEIVLKVILKIIGIGLILFLIGLETG
ncbi:hypothetical protein IEC_05452 [Bacillus toyonensis]|nr:hypothetical protein IEC_05452 [Bacillus toyonensis]